MSRTIDLDEVVRQVRKTGVDAYVEHTGGGCATIYAGGQYIDRAGDGRWQAVAGPGWFEGGPGEAGMFTLGRATTDEFFIGPDDDGESGPATDGEVASDRVISVTEDATEATVALLIVQQVAACSYRPGDVEPPEHPLGPVLVADDPVFGGGKIYFQTDHSLDEMSAVLRVYGRDEFGEETFGPTWFAELTAHEANALLRAIRTAPDDQDAEELELIAERLRRLRDHSTQARTAGERKQT
jgi:hypothetical protein